MALSGRITVKEKTVEKVIMLEKTYYTMNGNTLKSTKKLRQTTTTTEIEVIEVRDYSELSMLLEAQNSRTIDNVLLQNHILKAVSN